MKIAVVVLALFGAAFAASIDNNEFPEFRNKYVETTHLPEDDETPQLEIINGQEVVPHSIPYQIYMVASDRTSSWSCGGSLITTTYVLTAAHCLDGATSVRVTLGAHNLAVPAAGSLTVNGRRIIVHENYDDVNISNDVGLIELDRTITLTNTIKLSPLPTLRDVGINLEGKNARVSGWGLTNGFFGTTTSILLQTNNTIISNRECAQHYDILKNEEVCLSSANGRSACQGDSGGPLVIGNVQHGIVSYGSQFCLASRPSVYARVTSFLNWIMTHSNWRPA